MKRSGIRLLSVGSLGLLPAVYLSRHSRRESLARFVVFGWKRQTIPGTPQERSRFEISANQRLPPSLRGGPINSVLRSYPLKRSYFCLHGP
jgi:hypothetical protein